MAGQEDGRGDVVGVVRLNGTDDHPNDQAPSGRAQDVRRSGTFCPIERAREKQAAREQDEKDLREGKVTREELRKRNGFFSSLDLRNARVITSRNRFR